MMIALNHKNNIDKFVFISSLLMLILRKYLTSFFWDYHFVDKIQSLLIYIPTLVLLFQFIFNKYHNKKEIILLAIFSLAFILTKEGSILIFILLALGSQYLDDKYIVKSYFYIHMIFFVGYVAITLVNPDFASQAEYHYKWKDGVRVIRSTFGFANPNAAFYYLIPIYASYIFLRFKKYNNIDRILLIGLTILVYITTSSRTGFIAISGGLIFIEVIRLIDLKKNEYIAKFIKLIPTIFAIISILIGTVLSKITFLNNILSSRPRYWNVYLVKEGNILSLFGNNYSDKLRSATPIDNSYIYILSFLGIIIFGLLMYIIYKVLDVYIKENKKQYIFIAILFFIYSLAENILMEVSLNFALLIIMKTFIDIGNSEKINIYDYKSYKIKSKR